MAAAKYECVRRDEFDKEWYVMKAKQKYYKSELNLFINDNLYDAATCFLLKEANRQAIEEVNAASNQTTEGNVSQEKVDFKRTTKL